MDCIILPIQRNTGTFCICLCVCVCCSSVVYDPTFFVVWIWLVSYQLYSLFTELTIILSIRILSYSELLKQSLIGGESGQIDCLEGLCPVVPGL